MADDIDRAQELNLHFNEVAARYRKPETPAIGICHYCSEPVAGDAKFCDSECADAHAHEQEMLARRGRG